ncbi:RES domain-containing protein [Saccharicrinis sp. 156]|uniref:RES domain-containing protein n=1 Tax=Saccharicrinis sp. 156 TaxID=3417574 RepID=UPI003D35775D
MHRQLLAKKPPANRHKRASYAILQEMGLDWYENKALLMLKVPSALVPNRYNYVINTGCPLYPGRAKLVRSEEYIWDKRLF